MTALNFYGNFNLVFRNATLPVEVVGPTSQTDHAIWELIVFRVRLTEQKKTNRSVQIAVGYRFLLSREDLTTQVPLDQKAASDCLTGYFRSRGAKPRLFTRRKMFLILISAFTILSRRLHILQVVFPLVREIEALV
jgi:hypothetical protein